MDTSTISSIVMILLGAFVAFFGYRLNKIVAAIAMFIAGYTIGTLLLPTLNLPEFICFVGSIALGILGAIISTKLIDLSIFLSVGVFAFTAAYNAIHIPNHIVGIIIALVIAVVAACIAVRLKKPAIIVVTALGGMALLLQGLASAGFWGEHTFIPEKIWQYQALYTLVLAAIGAVYQFIDTKHIA